MSVFDRERKRWERDKRKREEGAAKAAEKATMDAARKEAEAKARAPYWDLRKKSEQFLIDSPFPELLEELSRYVGARTGTMAGMWEERRLEQFNDPQHSDFGATGLSLVKENHHVRSTGRRSYSYSGWDLWINVIALPDGTIKVEGNLLGKTVLSVTEWRDPHSGVAHKDVAEKAISKAWRHPHRRHVSGAGHVD